MSLIRWNPVSTPDIFSDLDSLFDHFFSRSNRLSPRHDESWTPRVDVVESDKAYKLHTEIPGIEKKDIDITVKDNILIISGEKKLEERKEGENYYRYERNFGKFERSFKLTDEVDAKNITAEFKNGVLMVKVPKVEVLETVATKIAIK